MMVGPFLTVKLVFLSCFIFAALFSFQDLSSPTRDLTRAYGNETLSPKHCTARGFSAIKYFLIKKYTLF